MTLHLFLELATLVSFLAAMAHALRRYERPVGAWWVGSMLWLGWSRETFVVVRDLLYGFAPLTLMAGKAPLIAAIIWGFSIHAAVVFAETVTGERLLGERLSGRFYALVGLFMVALAGFFEPLLELVAMARWQPGTLTVLGVPRIALLGYPTMAILLLWTFRLAWRIPFPRRALSLPIRVAAVALVHAQALAGVKRWLGW